MQKKIDSLNDSQLDRVLEFLEAGGDLDTTDGQEIRPDINALRPERQWALVEFVDGELQLIAQPQVRELAAPIDYAELAGSDSECESWQSCDYAELAELAGRMRSRTSRS